MEKKTPGKIWSHLKQQKLTAETKFTSPDIEENLNVSVTCVFLDLNRMGAPLRILTMTGIWLVNIETADRMTHTVVIELNSR